MDIQTIMIPMLIITNNHNNSRHNTTTNIDTHRNNMATTITKNTMLVAIMRNMVEGKDMIITIVNTNLLAINVLTKFGGQC